MAKATAAAGTESGKKKAGAGKTLRRAGPAATAKKTPAPREDTGVLDSASPEAGGRSATPVQRHLLLRFQQQADLPATDEAIHLDLSAAVRSGGALFLGCDKAAGVERLLEGSVGWGEHRHFSLGEWLDLPGGTDGEMEVEGLAAEDGWLWIVGSQSLKRGKAGKARRDAPGAGLAEMAKVARAPNRQFLGRVPLADRDGAPSPVNADGDRRIAHLPFSKHGKLRQLLKGDVHLDPYLDLPCKENGFDIAGLAVRGDRVWLGLRGPVLSDCAVIVELRLKTTKSGHLKARKIDGKRRYRKYLLPTAGLGVRDLMFHGADMLVLVGAPLAGDGPARILRWKEAETFTASQVLRDASVQPVLELPYRGQVDHPEAITAWPDGTVMVVYDSPAQGRFSNGPATVTADLLALPN